VSLLDYPNIVRLWFQWHAMPALRPPLSPLCSIGFYARKRSTIVFFWSLSSRCGGAYEIDLVASFLELRWLVELFELQDAWCVIKVGSGLCANGMPDIVSGDPLLHEEVRANRLEKCGNEPDVSFLYLG
jgi:hypothetical protein